MIDIDKYIRTRADLVNTELQQYFPPCVASTLCEAMKYSMFAGGKRIRPVLALASWNLLNGTEGNYSAIMPYACAVEMVHTYSLIHDDLPAMDNDSIRRGKPTNHMVFGDAVAILAGDALLTKAFNILPDLAEWHPSENVLKIVKLLSEASGMNGMVGGQVLDIENDGTNKIDEDYLSAAYRYKTTGLITASVTGPAVLLGMDDDAEILKSYGNSIGFAFQLVDDVLGVMSTREELGKTPNIDEANNKTTFVEIHGVRGASELARTEINKAKELLMGYGDLSEPLLMIADYIISRTF